MRNAALVFVAALAGCVEAPRECWRGDLPECEIGGNAGDGVASAPEAPEVDAAPAPAAKPDRPAPAPAAPAPAPVARPERPDKPAPAPAPEPEKPDYAAWAQPGDEKLFDGYSEAEVKEKQAFLARARSEAEAAAKAEQSGGFNR